MRNKVLLCGWIIVLMAFSVAFGYTNARYYSTASMTGDLDYVKTIGKISIYHPEWVGGYEGPDDGSGMFNVPSVGSGFDNIHYRVTNKANDEINPQEVPYYIRIVAEDGSSNMPIEYDVHEYNAPANVLAFEEGIGYGPFLLIAETETKTETEQLYSIKAAWTSADAQYMADVQRLKVQMVKKRIDGTLKVMDEAPLNIKYSGGNTDIASTVPVKFCVDDGSTPGKEVSSATVELRSDGTYEFTTDVCRTLCPELNNRTSFTVYVANMWGSLCEVGNTYTPENAVITVDYNATYTSGENVFKLTDEGSYIHIKAWW